MGIGDVVLKETPSTAMDWSIKIGLIFWLHVCADINGLKLEISIKPVDETSVQTSGFRSLTKDNEANEKCQLTDEELKFLNGEMECTRKGCMGSADDCNDYYFDADVGKCRSFDTLNCGISIPSLREKMFDTREECTKSCGQDAPGPPFARSMCKWQLSVEEEKHFDNMACTRMGCVPENMDCYDYFLDPKKGICRPFDMVNCAGHLQFLPTLKANMFDTSEDCARTCGAKVSPIQRSKSSGLDGQSFRPPKNNDKCHLTEKEQKFLTGMMPCTKMGCIGSADVCNDYYFDANDGTCRSFDTLNCARNLDKIPSVKGKMFDTSEDCASTCGAKDSPVQGSSPPGLDGQIVLPPKGKEKCHLTKNEQKFMTGGVGTCWAMGCDSKFEDCYDYYFDINNGTCRSFDKVNCGHNLDKIPSVKGKLFDNEAECTRTCFPLTPQAVGQENP